MLTARHALIAAAALAGGLVVGVLVGDLVRSDPTTTIVETSFSDPVAVANLMGTGDADPAAGAFEPIEFDTASVEISTVPDEGTTDGPTDEPDTDPRGRGLAAGDPGTAPEPVVAEGPVREVVQPVGDRVRLIDVCADGVLLDCPFGIAADVGPVLNDSPPLDILVSVRHDDDPQERCDIAWPDQPFDLPLMIMTTNPATIELTYSTLPDDFGQVLTETITIAAPGSDDPERTRWEGIVGDGGSMLDEIPYDWVQTCVNASRLRNERLVYLVDAVARDGFGHVAVFERAYQAPSLIDRRLPVVSIRSDNHLRIGPYVRDGEFAFVYPIDVTEPGAESCTDVEAAHVTGNRWPFGDASHPDEAIDRLIDDLEAVVDSGFGEHRYDWAFELREGSRYRLCIFYMTQGDRSFNPVEVVDRLEYEVFTPNRHRARVTTTAIRIDSLDAPLEIRPFTHPAAGACYGTAPRDRLLFASEMESQVEIVLCPDSAGRWVDNEMPIALGFREPGTDSGDYRIVGVVPIDTTEGCDTSVAGSGCVGSRVNWYDIPFGPDLGATGSLRLRVDLLPSRSQGAGNWVIGVAGLFEESGFVPTEGAPEADHLGLTARPITGRVDAIRVEFETDRPTTARLEIVGPTCEPEGGTAVSSTPTAAHSLVIEGLCADTHYSMTVEIEDAQGRTTTYPSGYFAGTFTATNPWESTLQVRLRAVGIDPAVASAWCTDLQTAVPDWTIPNDCYRWIEGPPSARAHGPSGDLYPVGFHCMWEDPTGLGFGHSPGTWYQHGEEILVTVDADLRLGTGCGAPREFFFGHVDRTFSTTKSDLEGGPASGVFVMNGIQWEVEILSSGTHVGTN